MWYKATISLPWRRASSPKRLKHELPGNWIVKQWSLKSTASNVLNNMTSLDQWQMLLNNSKKETKDAREFSFGSSETLRKVTETVWAGKLRGWCEGLQKVSTEYILCHWSLTHAFYQHPYNLSEETIISCLMAGFSDESEGRARHRKIVEEYISE